MKTFHNEIPYDFSDPITDRTFTEKVLFFDIETTGLSAPTSSLYLIGCACRRGGHIFIDQFFAETPGQEREILLAFSGRLNGFDTLATFNGNGFDIPYLEAKYSEAGLPDPFLLPASLDLFKIVSKLKFLLKLPGYRQKSIEDFLGVPRQDLFDGGELIKVYKSYVKAPQPNALAALLQHNYEDVLHMPQLLPVLSYTELLYGSFTVLSVEGNEYRAFDGSEGNKELLFTLKNKYPIPRRASCGNGEFYFVAGRETSKLRVRLLEGELKYFFPDYRDYYYLPEEDTAVHKSVAAYVDKAHRRKASPDTCYIKKYAIFLPQYEQIGMPLFREGYRDKKSYFELDEDFAESEELQKQYVLHALRRLASQK